MYVQFANTLVHISKIVVGTVVEYKGASQGRYPGLCRFGHITRFSATTDGDELFISASMAASPGADIPFRPRELNIHLSQ